MYVTDYLASLSNYPPAFESWAAVETDLAENLNEMAKLMSTHHDDYKEMVSGDLLLVCGYY